MGVSQVTPAQVLATPMQENDADAATVRDYLIKLLRGVWEEGEGFDGKRPFGNSSWEMEVYTALGRAGHIFAKFDSDGYLDDIDEPEGNRLVLAAIEALQAPDGSAA